jgi:glycosyltransferase involved in cell wall biosynthesis
MEIVLVDGGSTDSTVAIAERNLREGDIGWRIITNPSGTTPSNLNAGLEAANGSVLCRVDARSVVPPHYVRACREVLDERRDVVVVGGAQVALARDRSAVQTGIARALNNRYVTGGSRYRSGRRSGPSDTVYLGAFRTEDLRRVGGWDDDLLTNQDFDLNRRLGRYGIVWFDDRLQVAYLPRESLGALLQQYHRFGRWKVRYWRLRDDGPRPRQWLLLTAGAAVPAVGLVAVIPRRGRGRRVRRAGVVGALLLMALERSGCSGPEAGRGGRVVATAAMAVVAGGWLSGIVREMLSPREWVATGGGGGDGSGAA